MIYPTMEIEQLKKMLETEGGLNPQRLEQAVSICATMNQTLDKALVTAGILTERKMQELIAKWMGVPFYEKLNQFDPPKWFTEIVPIQFARYHNIMAIEDDNGRLRVVIAYPLDYYPVDELSYMVNRVVDVAVSPRAEINALINRAYQQKSDMVEEVLEDVKDEDLIAMEKEIELAQDILDVAKKGPIIRLVNSILFNALKMRASDVHVQPYEEKLVVRYRIDGILYDVMTPPKKLQEAIISRIKVMGKMDIAEKRLPQDGRSSVKMGDGEVDIRISSVPTIYGERIVMRLLDKTAKLYEMEEIGISPEDDLQMIKRLINSSHGIVLLTGPTGSGKTTTLYSALTRINNGQYNIITIEDPVEYHIPGISQIEVNYKKGLNFATGLRSIVRQDPDIIMVGEIRDIETANIAIQSALTGHLVFSTLHTNDAAGAVTRLVELGVEPFLVASSVIGVIAQRLVRIICAECKEYYVPTPEQMRQLGIDAQKNPGAKFAKGRGCPHCLNSGYYGRTAIVEILTVDDDVRNLIMQRANSTAIKIHSVEKRDGRTLMMDGARKVLKHTTSPEEVLSVTQADSF